MCAGREEAYVRARGPEGKREEQRFHPSRVWEALLLRSIPPPSPEDPHSVDRHPAYQVMACVAYQLDGQFSSWALGCGHWPSANQALEWQTGTRKAGAPAEGRADGTW